jgi:hypothetical protein
LIKGEELTMPNGTDVLKALTILTGYTKEDLSMCPEHDEIWIGHDIPPDKMTDADKERMKDLGFTWEEDIPAWHGFVSA